MLAARCLRIVGARDTVCCADNSVRAGLASLVRRRFALFRVVFSGRLFVLGRWVLNLNYPLKSLQVGRSGMACLLCFVPGAAVVSCGAVSLCLVCVWCRALSL